MITGWRERDGESCQDDCDGYEGSYNNSDNSSNAATFNDNNHKDDHDEMFPSFRMHRDTMLASMLPTSAQSPPPKTTTRSPPLPFHIHGVSACFCSLYSTYAGWSCTPNDTINNNNDDDDEQSADPRRGAIHRWRGRRQASRGHGPRLLQPGEISCLVVEKYRINRPHASNPVGCVVSCSRQHCPHKVAQGTR